ncbi:hypothetical protein [Runella sp.]|uniref:hypothetical protein n=1 Tax=Runella sp. TaxID=1960881 RepID=UPI003D14DE92
MTRVLNYSTLLIVFCSLFSCFSDEKKATVAAGPIYTLVFMDKTQSVNVNKAFVAQKYQQILSDLVEQNIRQKGDKLEVYFIHENTQKARALSLTCRTEVEDISHMNATDREAAQTTADMTLQRERMIFLRQLMAKLGIQNVGTSQRYTDIWASLPVINKATETGAEVKVYYLSDMIESMKGANRRDFHSNPPQDNAQAEEWAKADAKQMQRYALNAAEIKVALPFEPTSSTRENNPNVSQYWSTLLQELGAGTVDEL